MGVRLRAVLLCMSAALVLGGCPQLLADDFQEALGTSDPGNVKLGGAGAGSDFGTSDAGEFQQGSGTSYLFPTQKSEDGPLRATYSRSGESGDVNVDQALGADQVALSFSLGSDSSLGDAPE